jgi:hypothetical protein
MMMVELLSSWRVVKGYVVIKVNVENYLPFC